MKYVVDKRLQILIKNRLFDIEHVFLVYSQTYKNWLVISKYLKNSDLVGYTICEDTKNRFSLRFLTFSLESKAEYYFDVMYMPIPKYDTILFYTMIAKINFAITELDLKTKHQAALVSANKMIKF